MLQLNIYKIYQLNNPGSPQEALLPKLKPGFCMRVFFSGKLYGYFVGLFFGFGFDFFSEGQVVFLPVYTAKYLFL